MGTHEGVIKIRDIRRKGTESERWNLDKFNSFQGTPWEPIPGREGIELKTCVHVPKDTDPVNPVAKGEDKEAIPRRVRITREQIRMQGFIVGCPGCRAVNRGLPAVNHTEEIGRASCRERV